MHDTISTLRRYLGEDSVIEGRSAGDRYRCDFSGDRPCTPLAVVRPSSTEQVATTLRICNEHGQHVVVQGGMTGLAGGSTPRDGEIALSMERLSGVQEIDKEAAALTAWAGTPLQAVQEAAREAGLLFPLDLGARGSCTIGGNIATNAGGNEVLRFGMVRNLVLGLEVVLADGTVLSSMNKMLKNNAGYDLKQLFIGSEGTLGVITGAVLRLFPQLPATSTALCALESFSDAVSLLHAMQARLGGTLSAYELMWASYFHYVVDHVPKTRSPFIRRHPIYVLLETESADRGDDRADLEDALAWALENGLIKDAALAQSDREAHAFWEIRDGIGDITPQMYPVVVFDVSLAIGEMPTFLERIDTELEQAFGDRVTNLAFGHIGDGNLHLATTTGAEDDVEGICDIVYRATGEHRGSVSAEHGIGTLRRDYLHFSRSPDEIELMRKLKGLLDPKGILNNGRVIMPQAG